MTASRWLHLVTLGASFYNLGAVVLAQLGWGLWAQVGPDEFPAYHRQWFRGVQVAIWPPAAVAGLGALLQLRWRPPGAPVWAVWLGAALQVLNFGLTGAWWARWQAQLAEVRLPDGQLHPLYVRLMRTHWLRVALIATFAGVEAGMAVVSAQVSPRTRRGGLP
ncbi:MAG TPA: hypothetical protein VK066_30115 [Chloroflexota bacterium]|nr:hypothetical protein [Chloroflexota bacterium]